MNVAAVLALFVAALAPGIARAQCDEASVRAAVTSAPLGRRLRAMPETEDASRWRAGAVTVETPVIAPVLHGGCHAALVEYAWIVTDRRAPAFRRWRHGLAVVALREGHVEIVARHRLGDLDGDEPQYHSVSFDPSSGTIVSAIGGAGASGGWGHEEHYTLRGRRLVSMDRIHVGSLGRIGP